METVWLAWWYNGYEYDDFRVELVGVFTSKVRADHAGKKYDEKMKNGDRNYRGSCLVKEVKINKILEERNS